MDIQNKSEFVRGMVADRVVLKEISAAIASIRASIERWSHEMDVINAEMRKQNDSLGQLLLKMFPVTLCPQCGPCNLECDNCSYCGTDAKEAFKIS